MNIVQKGKDFAVLALNGIPIDDTLFLNTHLKTFSEGDKFTCLICHRPVKTRGAVIYKGVREFITFITIYGICPVHKNHNTAIRKKLNILTNINFN